MNFMPFSRKILPSSNLPTRIFGPCKSAMMATSRPHRAAASRTMRARSIWSCALPCEKFRRTTSTPALNMRTRVSISLEAGPMVATILVARCCTCVLMVCCFLLISRATRAGLVGQPFCCAGSAPIYLDLLGRHQGNRGVQHAVRETPLVVVPRRYFHEAARNLGQSRIEIRRCRVMVEIDGYQRLCLVREDAGQWAFRSGFQQGIDFLDGGIALGDKRQIDQRHVDDRHAHGKTVQLAIQFRQDQAHGGSSARLGRN